MTEHQNIAEMLRQEILMRHRTRHPSVTLADLRADDLEAFRMQSNIHTYDSAFHLLLEHWRQAVDEKQRAMQPPELPVVATKTESNWRRILRERFGIKV